ncbi:MAG: hypothetical protein NVSMB19_14430 [Vulcanimicrobiaceae bacterium]
MYDQVDEHNIPKSAGIPRVIYISAIVGIIAIFAILSLVFANSSANHAWPASESLTVPLAAPK